MSHHFDLRQIPLLHGPEQSHKVFYALLQSLVLC